MLLMLRDAMFELYPLVRSRCKTTREDIHDDDDDDVVVQAETEGE